MILIKSLIELKEIIFKYLYLYEYLDNMNTEININDEVEFWVPYPNKPPLQKGKIVTMGEKNMVVVSEETNKEWVLNIKNGLYTKAV